MGSNAPKLELRPISSMHAVEKLLLGSALVVGFLGLLYIFMVFRWALVEGVMTFEIYHNLVWVLLLLGFIINSIFLWRAVEMFSRIRYLFKKQL